MCPQTDGSMVEEDREAMAEVLVLVERLGRKVDCLIDPELRDGLEDEAQTSWWPSMPTWP